MSADGEIEVQVTAEGTDDAAEELADGDGGGVPGGGGGGGGDGDGLMARLGSIGRILGVIAALLASLGPLLKFIEGVFNVLSAFLAPIALIIVRLLSPFLRFFIRLLPAWFDFITTVMPLVEMLTNILDVGLQNLASLILTLRQAQLNAVSKLDSLPSDIWSFINRLPQMIGEQLGRDVPTFSSAADTGQGLVEEGLQRGNETIRETTGINIMGGLGAFVERVERESNIDLP